MKSYRGYIGSKMAYGRSVPQNVQQQVIRDYCAKNGLQFLLSATEFEGTTVMLNSIKEQGIVFYSMWLLPKDRAERRKLYNSGKDVRFAAENIHSLNREFIEIAFAIEEYHAGSQFRDTVAHLKQT